MSKKKDAMRREAMELAFYALKNVAFDQDKTALKKEFYGLTDSDPGANLPRELTLAWRLASTVQERSEELRTDLLRLSPPWLLDQLGKEEYTLLLLAFAGIKYGIPPKVALKNALAIVKSLAREQAFQTLYSLSFIESEDLENLSRAFDLCARNMDEEKQHSESQGFAWDLARGAWLNQDTLDRAMENYSHNWRLARIGRIELNLLRIGLYEIFSSMTAPREAIAGILELASRFGAGNARSFIGGILDAAAHAAASGKSPELEHNL